MEIKLIVTDLDGTLLTKKDEVHPDNIRALRRCQERGIKVCPCLLYTSIKAVWNFAPIELSGPSWMSIENVHLSDSLYTLSYRVKQTK